MSDTRSKKRFRVTATIWLYPGNSGAWHFVTIPKTESTMITSRFSSQKRGWGSLPVEVTLGETVWKTSIFPDTKSGTYLLPIKASIRQREGLFEGDTLTLALTVCV